MLLPARRLLCWEPQLDGRAALWGAQVAHQGMEPASPPQGSPHLVWAWGTNATRRLALVQEGPVASQLLLYCLPLHRFHLLPMLLLCLPPAPLHPPALQCASLPAPGHPAVLSAPSHPQAVGPASEGTQAGWQSRQRAQPAGVAC
jgi:hypothetical protein